jgi:hypothetical protein
MSQSARSTDSPLEMTQDDSVEVSRVEPRQERRQVAPRYTDERVLAAAAEHDENRDVPRRHDGRDLVARTRANLNDGTEGREAHLAGDVLVSGKVHFARKRQVPVDDSVDERDVVGADDVEQMTVCDLPRCVEHVLSRN